MSVFERNYKAAATTELERSVRALEERNSTAQTKLKTELDSDLAAANSNIIFAERINLITSTQGSNLRERLEKAQKKFERLERTEIRDIVDDFENPRERTERYFNMDEVNSKITKEKAEREATFANSKRTDRTNIVR